jgi:hypothetical protein
LTLPNSQFPLLDLYMGLRLEADLAALNPGRVAVVESPRRLKKELSYGYLHALWWVWMTDGRSAVSVPPGAEGAVRAVVSDTRSPDDMLAPGLAARLAAPVDRALIAHGLDATDRTIHAVRFACNAALLHRHRCAECRRITDESVPPAEGLSLPTHCFPDGIVYAVVADGHVASIAHAHRSHLMEDRVADLGVETAPAYRRRGYARTAVCAVVQHITSGGGEAIYGTGPGNAASIATARSVGFAPYFRALVLSSPAPSAEHQPPPVPRATGASDP